MSQEVLHRHRSAAYRILNPGKFIRDPLFENWVVNGIDGGPPLFEEETRVAFCLAQFESMVVLRWLRCEDRMPWVTSAQTEVDVFAPARGVDRAIWNGSTWDWCCGGYALSSEVTHWRPRPRPPRQGDPISNEFFGSHDAVGSARYEELSRAERDVVEAAMAFDEGSRGAGAFGQLTAACARLRLLRNPP